MAGILDFLRNNSMALMQSGTGLLSGATPQEQVSQGAIAFMNGRRTNKTVETLRASDPELAQAVEQGLLGAGDAFKLSYQRKMAAEKPKSPIEINGRLVDPNNYQVLADFSDKQQPAAKPSFETLPDGTYGWSDPNTQSFNPLGKAAKPVREDAQPLTATDKKALWSAEDEIPMLDNTLSSLERAKELNKKTFTGVTAGARGYLGSSVPGGSYLVDQEAAKATSEFGKLMSMEAIQSMAQSLKGATTDSELARFVEILADPAADPDIRERTIDRMSELARRVKEVKSNRVQELRGGGISRTPAGSQPGVGVTKSGLKFTVEQ